MVLINELIITIMNYLDYINIQKFKIVSKNCKGIFTEYCKINNIYDTYLIDKNIFTLKKCFNFVILAHNNIYISKFHKNIKYRVFCFSKWICGENHKKCDNGKFYRNGCCNAFRGYIINYKYLDSQNSSIMHMYISFPNYPKIDNRYIIKIID